MNTNDDKLVITPLFVLNELKAHSEECAKRWWAIMKTLVAGFSGIILFLAGLVVTLALKGH